MRVSISYPPIPDITGTPMISQNRQYQVFSEPTYIYPCVPAYAATLLDKTGDEVIWDDAIAEGKTYSQWLDGVERRKPELMMIETKTPVVKRHWRIVEDVKQASPGTKVALVGDHVTALPRESMENSKVDYILTGGDYDFLLLNLVEWLEGKARIPEPGIWYRENGGIKDTGSFKTDHSLDELPFINRDLTNWRLYSEENGNYKRTPGTYTMVGRDCWWHRCTFCAWTVLYPNFRVRSPELLVDEVAHLIETYHVKTVFDDTGTFPTGKWLTRFSQLMIERGYSQEIDFSCNMRFGACNLDDCRLMKKAGFRMLLFGLESASQQTLDRIKKGLSVDHIVDSCKKAKQAGLEPHLTIMVGYPWESREDAWATLKLAKRLFEAGWADSLQVTIVMPYPGTRLFDECKRQGLLRTLDWNDYDMRNLVTRCDITEEDVKEMTRTIYKLHFNPRYALKRLASIRSSDDARFIRRGAIKVLGHLKDFGD